MLTQKHLKERVEYDCGTGTFRWKNKNPRAMSVKNGEIAGHNSGRRMRRVCLDGKHYLLHRLAWLFMYGSWPKHQIDHINGDRSDNRISNLREANNSQNQANMKAKSNNRLGIRGIGYRRGKFIVQLRKDGICTRAYFRKLENAELFAREVSKALHGDFSIHSR
jgi:hypothetical protein